VADSFPRHQLNREPADAARSLLGALLVREDPEGRRVGRIVEVEAYGGPDDRASHARFSRSTRSAVMHGPPGTAYVYLVYGMYECLNVVCGPAGEPAAVLIRAAEPLEGTDLMRHAVRRHAADRRRTRPGSRAGASTATRLCSGPGRLGAAFDVRRADNGIDLCAEHGAFRIEAGLEAVRDAVESGPRIGVSYAGEPWASIAWRFWLRGSPAVSGRAVARATR
jgi:DNA-3-methyladenine glycosylase